MDGTGMFPSHEIPGEPGGENHHSHGPISYYHWMLAAVLLHPRFQVVFPWAPEMIQNLQGGGG